MPHPHETPADDDCGRSAFAEEIYEIIEIAEEAKQRKFVVTTDQPHVKCKNKYWRVVAVSIDSEYLVLVYTYGNSIVSDIVQTEEAIEWPKQAAQQERLMSRRDFYGSLALGALGFLQWRQWQKSQPVRRQEWPKW